MSDGVVIAIITSVSAVVLAIVNAVIAAIQRREQKKSDMEQRVKTMEERTENIDKKVDKIAEHSELQYLALLRLTVMDSDMPMSERLIAGKEYIGKGGNGDVKAFYEGLEKKVNG